MFVLLGSIRDTHEFAAASRRPDAWHKKQPGQYYSNTPSSGDGRSKLMLSWNDYDMGKDLL